MPIEPRRGRHDDVQSKVETLQQPGTYAERPAQVRSHETHMSWIFMTEEHVYKLKKPIRNPLLDFSTVAARRHYCLEEVRLNRRLSTNVYLGIAPLGEDAQGALKIGEREHVVDWLVWMRRLPADKELKHMIENATATSADAERVGTALSRFYLSQVPTPMSPGQYIETLNADLRRQSDALLRSDSGLEPGRITDLAERLRSVVSRARTLLTIRARTGRVIEGHGDLRPEHVYLTAHPQIIDCLEFNRQLRIADMADELSFLALECERLGAAWFGEAVFASYARRTDDRPPQTLRHFYMSYRALIWAALAATHPRDDANQTEHWRARADEYLKMCERHIAAAEALPMD